VRIDLHRAAEADLLELGGLRFGFAGLVLLGLLVLELAEVHDATNGGTDIRGHFHKVEAELAGAGKRLGGGRFADLVVVLVDEQDGAEADLLVDARPNGPVIAGVIGSSLDGSVLSEGTMDKELAKASGTRRIETQG
jgi:hypothetical protein